MILIISPAVSSSVRINYQVLGGHFQNDASGIISLYETAMTDDRPIAWENIVDKPAAYVPSLHRHLLEDLYGFEAVVASLERVRGAILLSDVPAFEAMIDWVNAELAPIKAYMQTHP
jgi:hypothetical protein